MGIPPWRSFIASQSAGQLGRGAVAGLAAGAAFLAVMAIDLEVTGRNVDDVELLGRFFVRDRAAARRLGLLIHAGNSAALGATYASVGSRLPGPPWLRGVTFAVLENAVLYPLARMDLQHPGIRDGSIARYWTWPAFVQSQPRHIAYGAVLGAGFAFLEKNAG